MSEPRKFDRSKDLEDEFAMAALVAIASSPVLMDRVLEEHDDTPGYSFEACLAYRAYKIGRAMHTERAVVRDADDVQHDNERRSRINLEKANRGNSRGRRPIPAWLREWASRGCRGR